VASERGGAVSLDSCDDVTFDVCQFTGNRAQRGLAFDVLGCEFFSLTSCTIADNRPMGGALTGAIYFGQTLAWSVIIETIIAFNDGAAVACGATVSPDPGFPDIVLDIHWVDIYENTGGDWSGCIEFYGDYLSNTNVDPRFCDMAGVETDEHDDFELCSNSPCLEDAPGNPSASLWGAHDAGPCGECDSAVESMSWGSMKALYLRP
jgi:hypothetical protein